MRNVIKYFHIFARTINQSDKVKYKKTGEMKALQEN
jgi:hypothetical protein